MLHGTLGQGPVASKAKVVKRMRTDCECPSRGLDKSRPRKRPLFLL